MESKNKFTFLKQTGARLKTNAKGTEFVQIYMEGNQMVSVPASLLRRVLGHEYVKSNGEIVSPEDVKKELAARSKRKASEKKAAG